MDGLTKHWMKEARRLALEEGERVPAQTWAVGRYLFEVIEQKRGEYAVRIKERGKEAYWLHVPELHYETEAGANYAILLFLQTGRA